MPAFEPHPVVLEGRHVRLEPLEPHHAPDLAAAVAPEIWRYLDGPPPLSEADVAAFIDEALAVAADGSQIPFATVHRASGRAVGSTRFMDIRPAHRALEIGWTWLGKPWQRTAANTEAKRLMLGHAFEHLGAVRVCLKTDARNVQSQQAIARLGAVHEGVLRRHMILWDGTIRDTVYYSILDHEWPAVKARLETRLAY